MLIMPEIEANARLQLRGICKRYPSVVANDHVNLCVQPGQIHALLGENGAGKSTLMKIIYGAQQPDSGEIYFNGKLLHIASPAHARQLGIAMVFQHFSLFDTLTVAENIALGLPADTKLDELRQRIVSTAEQYGLQLEPDRHVHTLSVGQCQQVEIVRALLCKPQLLILDEPTSVLTPQAVQNLFGTLRKLASEGCSIVYISHKLDEIRQLCEACSVLRLGKNTGVCDPRQESAASLSRLMIGSEPPALQHRPQNLGATVLQVAHLDLPKSHPFGCDLHDLCLQVQAGEILGLAGVSGNGQQELLAALSGEDRRAADGSIKLFGQTCAGPAQRRALGLAFVPEERLGRGAVPEMSLAENTLLTQQTQQTLRFGMIRRNGLQELAKQIIQRFQVKASGPQDLARSLSGGNLQKFIVGREVMSGPKLFLVAQPTWGVDVGAAAQIRAQLLALRDAGCAVLVISEELDELLEIADRLQVLAKGRLSPSLARQDASVELIGRWMSGLWQTSNETLDRAAPVMHAPTTSSAQDSHA